MHLPDHRYRLLTALHASTLLLSRSSALELQGAAVSGFDAYPDSNVTYLNITALRSSPTLPHHARLTCLRLPTPFGVYPTAGSTVPLSLPLSSGRNMTLVTLPPRSSEGWHKPPMPMWFVLLRGKAVVSTYDPTEEPSYPGHSSTARARDRNEDDARQQQSIVRPQSTRAIEKRRVTVEVGSPNQFLLALDLLGQGHWTDYPSDEETWALQVPLAEGWEEEIRSWKVVGEGPCT